MIIVAVITVNGIMGQGKASSPYSVFGIGDLKHAGSVLFPEYGGASAGLMQKNVINFTNPAAYRSIDSMRFLLDFGLTDKFSYLDNDIEKHYSNDFKFAYYAVGMRILPWWGTSLGMLPSANRNYRIASKASQFELNSETYYIGSGAMNELYFGNSFIVLPNFSVGINVKYYFGELRETKTILFPDEPFMRNTQEGYSRRIQGFGFSTGAMYTINLPEDKTLNIGATFAPMQRINFKEDYIFGATVGANLENTDDNVMIDITESYVNQESYFNLPTTLGFGLSYTELQKQFATISVDYAMWEDCTNDNIENSLTVFNNSMRVGAGYEFIPKWNSVSNYFKRATYRFGAFFENQYVEINDKSINEFAVSLGVGFPIRRVDGMFNVGLELGQRGSLQTDLIKENYIKLNLKFNFREIWFFERKYD